MSKSMLIGKHFPIAKDSFLHQSSKCKYVIIQGQISNTMTVLDSIRAKANSDIPVMSPNQYQLLRVDLGQVSLVPESFSVFGYRQFAVNLSVPPEK